MLTLQTLGSVLKLPILSLTAAAQLLTTGVDIPVLYTILINCSTLLCDFARCLQTALSHWSFLELDNLTVKSLLAMLILQNKTLLDGIDIGQSESCAECWQTCRSVTNCCMSVTPIPAGSASAVDFQQPLALTVELARVAEDHKAAAHPDDAIGDLGASPADIADAVSPANDSSPAQGIANKVIENIQPNSSSSQKLSDALGSPATDDAPKLQDAIEQPAELLKPGREASIP